MKEFPEKNSFFLSFFLSSFRRNDIKAKASEFGASPVSNANTEGTGKHLGKRPGNRSLVINSRIVIKWWLRFPF